MFLLKHFILIYFNKENKTWGKVLPGYVEVESTTSIWNNHIQLRRVALDLHYCPEY